ncbi:MAG: leucine-rich repeat protein, partial [Lachnospiraceae bacterium]|nr:leucine-rich repeat protein [Lachnospiraceae bacterium]
INDYAFYHCDNLLEINIPESVTEISRYAFWQCNMLLDESKDQIKAVNKKVRFDYVK